VTTDRLLAAIGALFALMSVAAGAFGAHALRDRITPDLLAVFETAARYQMYHALALILGAVAYGKWGGAALVWAGWLFVVGVTVFSGSLYILALTGTRWWGAVTPIGGVCFLLGWVLFVWGLLSEAA
jgi:uncharacterized membrane protein YgdD (TMEM256/DUF423 family)